MKEPWRAWKKKTKREKAAIASLKEGKKIILENIPKKNIIAIYVKGSFIRREMNEKSDVDLLTIVDDNRVINKIEKIEKKYRNEFKPKIQITGLSITELRTGKRYITKNQSRPKAHPSRILKQIDEFILLHGKSLDTKKFKKRTDKKDLMHLVKAFGTMCLPNYLLGKIGFDEIVKQVFWLVELDEKYKGNHPPHGFKKLAKSIKDKDHIVKLALKCRNKKTKDLNDRKQFIEKLRKYLDNLKKIK